MHPNPKYNTAIDDDNDFDAPSAPRKRQQRPASGSSRQGSRNGEPRHATAQRPTPDPEGPRPPKRKPQRRPPEPKYTFIDFLQDYRTRLGLGIFLCLLAVVTAVCCISFIFNNQVDQSVIYGRSVVEIVDAGDTVENAGGVLGAKLSELLMVNAFGIGSIILAIYVFLLGLAVMGLKKCNFFRLSARCLFTTVAISIVVGLVSYNRTEMFHLGGAHGYYINELLYKYSDSLGAYSASVLMLGLLIAVYLYPLKAFFSTMHRGLSRKAAKESSIEHPLAQNGETDDVPSLENLEVTQAAAEAVAESNAVGEIVSEDPVDISAFVPDNTPHDEVVPAADAVHPEEVPATTTEPMIMPAPALEDIDSGQETDRSEEASIDAIEGSAVPDISAGVLVTTPIAGMSAEAAATAAESVAATATVVPAATVNTPPAATLEQLDAADSSEDEEIDVPDDTDDADDFLSPVNESEVYTLPGAPDEPEMVIVTHQPAEIIDCEPYNERIPDGAHIGIDVPYDPRASHSQYRFPTLELLEERDTNVVINAEEQAANKQMIVNALRSYNIEITKITATIGPTVTLYEIIPEQGIKISKIKSLEDDIAMNLAALGIRIIAPMPGKGTIGIEVPNRKQRIVSMRELLNSPQFKETKMQLPLALGATISNDIFMADLAKMPHLLVAGATGQGKSVGLNCIIASLLYSKHPDELKFVLIDPKMVEFSLYQRIANQFMAKIPEEDRAVITDPQKVVATLKSLCTEMDERYKLLMDAGVRDMKDYNQRFIQRRLNPNDGHRFMPYIVMIVDEFADLIMTAGKDVSEPIARIAQKARAVGMHMIIATQRPSTDVITGMIKANFPARIAFKVTQGVDSKTILDRPGAQRLVGRGDMLAMLNGTVERVQCALVDTPEVENICEFIGNQQGFLAPYELPEPPVEGGAEPTADVGQVNDEFKRCAIFIASQSQASITMMQRRFEIGFNKAGRYMDQMYNLGIVGPANGAKPRQVLMTPDEVERLFATM